MNLTNNNNTDFPTKQNNRLRFGEVITINMAAQLSGTRCNLPDF